MGGALKGATSGAAIGSVFGPVGTGLGALGGGVAPGLPGSVMGALGLDGAQQSYYEPGPAPVPRDMPAFKSDIYNEQQGRMGAAGSNQTAGAMQGYGQGNMSYADALAQAQQGQNGQGQADEIAQKFATDGVTGSRLATEQVQGNGILGKTFGKGGLQDRTMDQEKDLAGRGYSLQPEDYEAYGQASGDIARQFGTADQSLAQSLAQRGLASAGSGAAVSGYAGLQGNKFEQLAGIQTQIAQQRMDTNMKRLNDTRTQLNAMNAQGIQAVDQQYGRQLSGAKQGSDARQSQLKSEQDQYKQDSLNNSDWNKNQTNLYGMQSDDRYRSQMNQQDREGMTLGKALGRGLGQATANAPGVALGAGARAAGGGAA